MERRPQKISRTSETVFNLQVERLRKKTLYCYFKIKL